MHSELESDCKSQWLSEPKPCITVEFLIFKVFQDSFSSLINLEHLLMYQTFSKDLIFAIWSNPFIRPLS